VSLTNYPLISRPCVGRREPKVTSFSIGSRLIGRPARCLFDRPGEGLLAAYSAGVLAAIGGITIDPMVPDALRMRRFYVRPAFRRTGIGREIALALLEGALQRVRVVTLNAAEKSVPFWEALGFEPEVRDGHTHIWRRAEPNR
jgi:GNAT superfamily N-acetyltransferase